MIVWIKSHKILVIALTLGLIGLWWIWKKGYLSSSGAAPAAGVDSSAYLASLYGAPSAGGGANVNAGQGGTGLIDLGTLQGIATPGGAVNQPGTSGSGVPSHSNQNLEFTPNTKATPAPSIAPIATGITFGQVTAATVSPAVALPCSPNDANCFTTPSYVKAINQDVSAYQSNQGLAPAFTQAQYDQIYGATMTQGAQNNYALYNAALGHQDVIAPGDVVNREYAAAGLTPEAINAGAQITGWSSTGQAIVDWGSYNPTPTPTASHTSPAPITVTPDQQRLIDLSKTGLPFGVVPGTGPGSAPSVTPPDSFTRTITTMPVVDLGVAA